MRTTQSSKVLQEISRLIQLPVARHRNDLRAETFEHEGPTCGELGRRRLGEQCLEPGEGLERSAPSAQMHLHT